MSLHVSRISPFTANYEPAEIVQVQSPFSPKTSREYASNPIDVFKPEIKSPRSSFGALQPSILPVPFIDKYVNVEVVGHATKVNPKIRQILEENGVPVVISAKNIGAHTKRHLFTTYLYAMEIAREINLDSESTNHLMQAALLHDIGKALIPEEIIQKPGKLTPEERKIVNLHSELSSEILKTTDVSPIVVNAVDKHHSHSEDKDVDLISQILSVADVFSALKEERSYKKAMPDDKAFNIMENMDSLSQPLVASLKLSRHKSGAYHKV